MSFRDLLIGRNKEDTHPVDALPQPNHDRRAPRLNLSDITPAVLRFEDGHRTQGQLEVISLTGGILSLAKPVVRQSRVKLMFVTPTGPVLGTAEMLTQKEYGWLAQFNSVVCNVAKQVCLA